MTLRWEGRKLTARMRAAQVEGVNRTLSACVIHARRNHAWRNRTGTLEGSIDVVDYAADGPLDTPVRGRWGSLDVRYALIHELGGWITAKTAKALRFRLPDGAWAMVKRVFIPARPYLRPAADAEYPKLSQRIRRAFERPSAVRP